MAPKIQRTPIEKIMADTIAMVSAIIFFSMHCNALLIFGTLFVVTWTVRKVSRQ